MDRKERLLAGIDLAKDEGLEIGALCRPVVRPEDGRIEYVDHMDTAGLKAKYGVDPGVQVEDIVPVSYVWGEKSLPEAVGAKRFDYVIASHVIEHVPDMIGWLREIIAVLKPGGKLSLAIPDKRYTFDCRRENTSFAVLVESHMARRRQPSFTQILDHFHEVAAVPSAVAPHDLWFNGADPLSVPRAHPDMIAGLGEDGLRHYYKLLQAELYLDVHCQVFTPSSFLRILSSLAETGLLEYRVYSYFDTSPGAIEFFVGLEKLPEEMSREEKRTATLESLLAFN